jgi:exopolysaccharide biosynthesis WecB/TagA/CpsF family protein
MADARLSPIPSRQPGRESGAAGIAVDPPFAGVARLALAPVTLTAPIVEAGTARFLGLDFQKSDFAAVLDRIAARQPDLPFEYVVTPNVDHVVRLETIRSDLWPAYRKAWLTLCDSRILARLAEAEGLRLPVIPGSDLTAALFDKVIAPDDRVAVLGGSAAMIAELCRRYGLTNVQHYNPPMGFIHNAHQRSRALSFLIDAQARYTLFAVGSPQQEILAYKLKASRAATGVGLCIGASLEFLSNEKSRAPLLIQKLSLEWLYRLAQEPRRMWRRYLVDGPRIFAIVQHWRRTT